MDTLAVQDLPINKESKKSALANNPSSEGLILGRAKLGKGILFLLTVASALLVSASFPPFDIGFLAWFALVPLLFALRRSGAWAAAGFGFLFGFLFGIGAFSWVPVVDGINLPKFLLIIVPIFSMYFLIFGFLYRLISRAGGTWIILGAPALWVALEYLRANFVFVAWPWNLLGHSQYRYLPVIQIADVTGVYGISFLIFMANQWLSRLPDFLAGRRPAASTSTGSVNAQKLTAQPLLLAVLLGITFFYGWRNLNQPDESGHLRVALVQGNVLARDNMPFADQVKHLKAYQKLTLEAASTKPALIVWPATSLPAPMSSNRLVRFTVQQLARETGAHLLVGGAGHEKFAAPEEGLLPFSNTEFLIAPTGRFEGQYNKIQLLPFNEYLPLQDKITWPKWLTSLRESFVPGAEYTLFEVSGAKFGTPICWENMFPDLFRRFVKAGAQFMVSVTNEGFLGRTAAPYQSLAINAFRAVENRVAIVRAAATGVSAFINADGEIVERVGGGNPESLFVSGVLVRDVPLSDRKTFYTVYGDIFAYFSIGLAVLSVVAAIYIQKWMPRRKGHNNGR
jgi:apolipoprotein N-acyltransferase